MTRMKGFERKEDIRAWVGKQKNMAAECFSRLDKIASDVFSSIDQYSSFLDLMARVSYYDAYNLLLIWEKCPNASFLAGYKYWEKKLPLGARILKKEHQGNGIDLVAPFTDNVKMCLTWYSVGVYDISQVNAPPDSNTGDSAYIQDDAHESILIDALKEALSLHYGKSVLIEKPSQAVMEADLPGEIRGSLIITRDDLTTSELISWLTIALSQLAVNESGLEAASGRLLGSSICYCLLHIWGLGSYSKSPNSSLQLRAIDAMFRISFLHLLRDTVRELNNLVASCYLAKRQDEKEQDESDMTDFLSPYH